MTAALVDVVSRVRAVTVYRAGALVTRVAELERGEAGFPSRLQLVGLPLSLEDGSVRVELERIEAADLGLPPIAGDVQVSLAVPGHEVELAPPTNVELDQAKLELALITAELEQLVRAEAHNGKLQLLGRGKPEPGKPAEPSPTAARLELLSFRRERAERLAGQILIERERERVAKQRLASLFERERLATNQRSTRTYELRKAAILTLDRCVGPDVAARVRIKLHYFVPGARWAPTYTIRLDRSMRSASLELRAMVGQATGEDWTGVGLSLSTASPQQWTELVELESQRIGNRQPPPSKTGWRPPPIGAGALYADFDRGLAEPLTRPSAAEPEIPTYEPETEAWELSVLLSVGNEPAPSGPPLDMAFGQGAGSAHDMPMTGSIPPPQPMSAPKRGGGMLSSLAGAAAMPVAMLSQRMASGGGEQARQVRRPEPPPEPELVAGRELLDYGRLRLDKPTDPRRGSLRRISTRELYLQVSSVELVPDLAIDRISHTIAAARTLDQAPAPAGHVWPASEGGFDYAYVADAPCELASDGKFHSLPIDQRPAESNPRYVSVPRETQDVFRIVSLRNPLAAPLLPGPVDVYLAGKFALTTSITLTPIGGRLELGLGIEQAIKIARNVVFSEDSSGMFKRQIALRHVISIEIANHLGDSATVEIRERLPVVAVGSTDEIKVEVEHVEPGWEDYEPKQPPLIGGRRWTVEVAANQTRKLEARWVVSIPTNHELVGGNRREV